ncbi:hypothetical protein VKS41_003895 [Umbelopsis sp. WA50703]
MRHEGRGSRDSGNSDMRSQRTSHNLTERSFGRDRNASADRGFRNSGDKLPSDSQARNSRSRPNDRFSDRNPEMQRNRRESHRDNNATRNQKGRGDHVDGTPEWMDYDPEAENIAKNKTVDGKDKEPEFINDLEAWKSKMKQQDKDKSKEVGNDSKHVQNDSDINVKATENSTPVMEQPQGTKGSANDNVDDMFANYSHNVADTTMAFDNFGLSGSNSGLSSPASIPTSNKGGSRFAKFFSSKQQDSLPSTPTAKDDNVSPRNDTTPKSISLDTLFQSQSSSPDIQRLAQAPGGKRMLSENDILQSLGANNAKSAQADSVNDTAGFNKVLEALSKSKPQVMQPPQGASHIESRSTPDDQLRKLESVKPMMGNSLGMPGAQQASVSMNANSIPMNHERQDILHMQQRMQATEPSAHQQRRPNEAVHSPVLSRPGYVELASQNSPGRQRVNSQNSPSQRPKMVASNLPTSVLRQLSAKSSESPGKSPSPNVHKQQASYSPTQARNMPAGQYPQHPEQPGYGYNAMPMYQQARPPPPVAGGYPGSFMEMGGPNMTVEQMMQLRNGLQGTNAPPQPSPRGNMPPMPMMGNMPPYPPYMMGNSPGAMQGPPPGPHGYPADMRPPPKEHFMGMLPGANMPNAGGVPPQFFQQGPAGNGMGMNRMMPPNFDGYERSYGGKP